MLKKKSNINYQNEIDKLSKKGIHATAIGKKELEGEDVTDFFRMIGEN